MAHSFHPPQTSMTGYAQEPPPLSAYSILGQSQYPQSVALWSSPSAQQQQPQSQSQVAATPYTPATPKTPSLLQSLPDQKKHKRTRSGCFTCRSRRIKCDENRPVCERCRKGNRECVYPSSTTGSASKAAPRSVAKVKASRPPSRGSDSSGPVESLETDEARTLETIADEEEVEASPGSSTHQSPTATGPTVQAGSKSTLSQKKSNQSLRRAKAKQQTVSTTDPLLGRKENSSSPTSESSSRFGSFSARSDSVGFNPFDTFGDPSTAHLPEDLRFYLSYHRESIEYRHYFLHPRSANFVDRTLVEYALQYEPLLYAIVGFSAYHHCVQTGDGKLYSFLKYYNKALSLLRKSLGSGEPYSEPTLATVLVLTTFEEFIGDWVNLVDHHQAAHALIRELLTPETACSDTDHRHLFEWYARFDVVAGVVSGNELVLGREWYIAREEYDAKEAARHPDDVEKQLTLTSSINRRFGLEMASLYAKLSSGMLEFGEFMVENEKLGQNLERVRDILNQFAKEYVVESYPNQKPLTEDDIVDPYVPGGLHYGPLWDINFCWIDYWSTKAMWKFQFMMATQQGSMDEMLALSLEQVRLIETMERWPDKEKSYMFGFKNSIGMASLFLPRDGRYLNWSRRVFAHIEQNGYVLSPKLRAALAAIWQLPEINHWWLPDDKEYPAIIREVRQMTEERTTNPRDNFRESVRDMRGVFGKLNLDDTESETSPPSVGTDAPRSTGSNQ
ncbi:Zn(II)2Cys6 transcription factor [Aspergillus undulatus]|uniref:Zn(II)2Cys6 transcription factor n=1 Tax=Aspergillus undulatus TaxID=1810928 RepID=UPI003CCCAF2D